MGKTTAKKAHYLQHVDFEGLGFIETWLVAQGFTVTATRFYGPPYTLPDPADIDLLIVMGGPMGIYDELTYIWLKEEKAFIHACIAAGVKMLGICLGAQLIADCLGARVHPAPHKEIGWFGVQTTLPLPDMADGPAHWVTSLFETKPVVFHWHGDQFDLPAGCVNLLKSAANTNQAFVLADQVIGLQFHLEVTKESLAFMLEKGREELSSEGDLRADLPYVQSAVAISASSHHIENCNQLLTMLLNRWLLGTIDI